MASNPRKPLSSPLHAFTCCRSISVSVIQCAAQVAVHEHREVTVVGASASWSHQIYPREQSRCVSAEFLLPCAQLEFSTLIQFITLRVGNGASHSRPIQHRHPRIKTLSRFLECIKLAIKANHHTSLIYKFGFITGSLPCRVASY